MHEDLIPPAIQRFITENIESVGELEALLILRGDRAKKWTALALSNQLYIGETQTEEILRALVVKGLVFQNGESSRRYVYKPASAELDEHVDALAKIYSRHIVAVTNLIHSNLKLKIQGFADAFRFRKEDG